jgi:hypothetical protein
MVDSTMSRDIANSPSINGDISNTLLTTLKTQILLQNPMIKKMPKMIRKMKRLNLKKIKVFLVEKKGIILLIVELVYS